MWIARDKSNSLIIYEKRPVKGREEWIEEDSRGCAILSDWFPEVNWEDEEPRELVLKPIKE